MSEYSVLGKKLPRVDGLEKVTGAAQYGADIHRAGMLYGKLVRSKHPHAKILSIDTSEAEKLPGVRAIVTQNDVESGRRVFATDKVLYLGEPIAAVAATDPDIAEEAAELVRIDYEVLPVVQDVMQSIQPTAPRLHSDDTKDGPTRRTIKAQLKKLQDDESQDHSAEIAELNAQLGILEDELYYNISAETHSAIGDVEAGFAESDLVVEDTYVIPRVHQTYMEPHVSVADVDSIGKITVWASTQGPFAIRSGIAGTLGIPLNRINVIPTTMGGGFGGRFGVALTHVPAVLLSQKTGRPVKLQMTREEEFLDGRPAPGCVIKLKTGVTADGRILVRQALGFWDSGSVSGASIGSTIRVRGVYKIPNLKVDAYGVYTNKSGTAAYRAPGTPQVAFAGESQLDEIARQLGIDPVEFRLKNLREEGDLIPGGGQRGGSNEPKVGYKETLQAVADAVDWKNRTKGPNQGWGVAIGDWTNGCGPGGMYVSVHEDGSVRIFHGSMDITGTDTALAQIVAEILTVPYEQVTITRGDTDSAPYATGSGGSVVTFTMGNTAKLAAEDTCQRILELAAERLNTGLENLELKDGKVSVLAQDSPRSISLGELAAYSLSTTGGPIVGKGSFARQPSTPALAAQIAKIEVDPEAGRIKVLKMVSSQDVGFAINPMAVEGQIEGGTVQGYAWATMEEMQYDENGNVNPGFVDYRVPTSADLPTVESVIVEVEAPNGPFGAKGVGEPPIIPTLAAMANAVADAVGVRVTELPMKPERVLDALSRK
ncbi:MAG: xanthine dehydrogenase family protein molybdopterin-binding subunit [Candidatus Poribacteria bacterium]|nr:xanthine dehydrogenase family protein molybdopterin-binding subunit [Candidatus Poribacteria bacterium]